MILILLYWKIPQDFWSRIGYLVSIENVFNKLFSLYTSQITCKKDYFLFVSNHTPLSYLVDTVNTVELRKFTNEYHEDMNIYNSGNDRCLLKKLMNLISWLFLDSWPLETVIFRILLWFHWCNFFGNYYYTVYVVYFHSFCIFSKPS